MSNGDYKIHAGYEREGRPDPHVQQAASAQRSVLDRSGPNLKFAVLQGNLGGDASLLGSPVAMAPQDMMPEQAQPEVQAASAPPDPTLSPDVVAARARVAAAIVAQQAGQTGVMEQQL